MLWLGAVTVPIIAAPPTTACAIDASPGVGWVLASLALIVAERRARTRGVAFLGLVALIVVAGIAGQRAMRESPVCSLRDRPAGLEGPWRVRGVTAREPMPAASGSRVRLVLQSVRIAGHWTALSGQVELNIAEPAPLTGFEPGTRVEVFVALRRVLHSANPGERMRLPPEIVRAGLKSYRQLRVVDSELPRVSARAALRRLLRQRIPALFGPHHGLVRALMLGERDDLPETQRARFARAGIAHVLAISGLHVGMFVAASAGAVRALGQAPSAAAVAAMVACGAILAIVAPGAPVQRAAVMALSIAAARFTGRRIDPVDALVLAVIVLVASHPPSITEPAFLMSAGATIAIIRSARGGRWWSRAPRVTVAAHLAVLPFIALTEAALPIAGLLANLALAPVMALALPAIALALILDVLGGPGPAGLIAAFAGVLLDAIDTGARLAPAWSVIAAPGATWWSAVAWWSGASIAASFPTPHVRLAGAGLFVLGLAGMVGPQRSAEVPEFIAFDVGQGDALALISGDAAVVVDGGGYPGVDYDPGRRIIVPGLRRLGATRLNAVALSHAHADHLGGLGSIAEALPVSELWLGPTPPGVARVDELVERARQRGTTSLTPTGVRRAVDACQWGALPISDDLRRRGVRRVENDASLALVAECSGRELWLTGDAGTRAERDWPAPDHRRTILKVGHHGSEGSTSPGLLRRLQPLHAIISVGARNPWALPRDAVVDRLRAAGMAVYRTDRDGAVRFRLGTRVTVRGQRWVVGS